MKSIDIAHLFATLVFSSMILLCLLILDHANEKMQMAKCGKSISLAWQI